MKSRVSMTVVAGLMLAQGVSAEPGYRWEMTLRMQGMNLPGMGGGQVQCLPAKGNDTPGMDEKCTVLESKRTGNRYRWKARCDGSVSTGDFTYQGDASFKGTVTVQDGGETLTMEMSGKRLGKCDYQPPRIVMPDMSGHCEEALKAMEPALFFGRGAMCANRKEDFCARVRQASPEAYGRMADRVQYEKGAASTGVVTLESALKQCGVKLAELKHRHCKAAVADGDCDFINRYCPESKAACVARDYTSGRSYSAADGGGGAASGGSGGAANPLGQGLNTLKGLFGF